MSMEYVTHEQAKTEALIFGLRRMLSLLVESCRLATADVPNEEQAEVLRFRAWALKQEFNVHADVWNATVEEAAYRVRLEFEREVGDCEC
jgi:hypothetical protein